MKFIIDSAELLEIGDLEIWELLSRAYVDEGFTSPDVAATVFEPSDVRSRGKIIAARDTNDAIFAGMVIVVYPDSPGRRLAQADETEMHLLAVRPEYRGNGLGRALVESAVGDAEQSGYSTMILFTQPAMYAAHRLYESTGFVRVPDRDFTRNGREFLVYRKTIDT